MHNQTEGVSPTAVSASGVDDAKVLEVEDLCTCFHTDSGTLMAVDGVSFSLGRGRILGLVGESGCGKSVTAFSILRLIRKPGEITGGRVMLYRDGGAPVDMVGLSEKSELLYSVRGGMASMIFQEPMTALSPVHSVGNQVCEAILTHQKISRKEAEQRAIDMLKRVGIPDPAKRLKQYPFEFSGGMRQRVMIAMALVCNPRLLIADEPTTALDVTIQAQILNLIKQIRKELGTAVLLITHDLGVVAQTADEVAVMYLGRIVEHGDVRTILRRPLHPYTVGLFASLPSMNVRKDRLSSIPGSVPSLNEKPRGCPFHPRCSHSDVRCRSGGPPELRSFPGGRQVACLRIEEIYKEL